MKVTLIDYMGTDDSVCLVARVSFNKHPANYTDEQNAKLIKYLATHKHEIPFAHTAITLRVQAPISIRTQVFKHKIGFVENEVSRRYVSNKLEYYLPVFRESPNKSIKQGSGEVISSLYIVTDKNRIIIERTNDKAEAERLASEVNGYANEFTQDYLQEAYVDFCEQAINIYNQMLKIGVAPEQARFVLPQGMMTEWVWTGSLLAFARFYNLRTDPHAQKEIQDLAIMVGEIIEPLYPVSWAALTRS